MALGRQLGRQPSAARAAATFLWPSGALHSALGGLSLKIRTFGQLDLDFKLVWLCEVGEITSEVYGFRPCRHSVKETSNVTNFATLLPHPEDTARRFARSKAPPGPHTSSICYGAQKITDARRCGAAKGSYKRRSRPGTAARVLARTLGRARFGRGADR